MIRAMRRTLLRLLSDRKSVFLIGFLIGAFLAIVLHIYQTVVSKARAKEALASRRNYDFAYERWLRSAEGLESFDVDPDIGRYNFSQEDIKAREANFLHDKIHTTCIVLPDTELGALTVQDTWGPHCNSLRFFSHKFSNASIPVEKIKSGSSFELICSSLHRIVQDAEVDHQGKKVDWVLVTSGDNTFALIENLRYFVAPMNQSEPHYLGHAMRFWGQVYNWGDAGFVLSRAAVDKILEKFPTSKSCAGGGRFYKNGDWYLGKHLSELGVVPRDTRDHMGRSRFNGYTFKKLLFPGGVSLFERYWRDSLYLSPDGPHCCSNFAVTFHGITSRSKMYQLEYLFHHLRPFYNGGKYGNVPRPVKEAFFTWEEKLKQGFLDAKGPVLMTTHKPGIGEHALSSADEARILKNLS